MSDIHTSHYVTPYGKLILGEYQEELVLCDWQYRTSRSSVDKRIKQALGADYQTKETPLIRMAKQQLEEFFEQKRQTFDLPVLSIGTEFQKQVWKTLLSIPYGKTETYLGLSRKLGDEKAIRAVASANGANAISIIIPCHRVIGSNNELTGYAGGLNAKRKLLELEGAVSIKRQLNLFNND